jgi:hypothetical protein
MLLWSLRSELTGGGGEAGDGDEGALGGEG